MINKFFLILFLRNKNMLKYFHNNINVSNMICYAIINNKIKYYTSTPFNTKYYHRLNQCILFM